MTVPPSPTVPQDLWDRPPSPIGGRSTQDGDRPGQKGTVEQQPRPCERCGVERPSNRTRYCSDRCSTEARKDRTRERDDGRIKPCPRCGGPKERGKRRYCLACREELLPVWQQQEYERSRRKAEKVKQRRAEARADAEARALRDGTPMPKAKREPRPGPNGTLRCNSCEQYLQSAAFSRSGPNRLNPYCKPCYSAYSHNRMLQKTYGISADRYEELLDQQGGRCAICLKTPRSRRLAVDHDHRNGQVRGLLCGRCNHKLLGAANDSVVMLTRAAAYLEAPPAQTGDDPATLPDYWQQRIEMAVADAEEANPSLPPFAVIERDGQQLAAMSMSTLVGLLKQYEQATGLPLTITVQEDLEDGAA
jgi:hypothetical protein